MCIYQRKCVRKTNITHEAIPENKDLPLQYLDSLDLFFSLFFFLFTVVATFYAINIE